MPYPTENKANWYFTKPSKWQTAVQKLRALALVSGLTEGLTYGKPTYYIDEQKIFLIHPFKDYVAILFFKGVLMQDPENILIQQTENVQAGRQLRFSSVDDITSKKKSILKYIQNAIEVEKSGKQVVFKKTTEFVMVEEFKNKLADSPELAEAFYALTPGRQRGYLLYFSAAKQSKTRGDRIAKCTPYILRGKGLLKGSGFEE
ncbi:MAG: YdeI/OmpD-associated family protein [bacterium]